MTTKAICDQFVPVAIETLIGADHADFDLFFHPNGGKPLLFRSRDVPVSDADLERLAASGMKTLLISYSDREAYEAHLRSRAESGDLSLSGRYALEAGDARCVFEEALRGNNIDCLAKVAGQFGGQLADMLGDERPHLRDMFDLMLHDYYTFTHSANVATYCVGIAQELGISDRAELTQIASGALLHDIGKRQIPRPVLNAARKLTEAEREIIQRHPQIGFEELSVSADLCWGQLMMVYQHHERLDGRGYPVGIVGTEIDPWAKICTVADVFDALTCDRSYRTAVTIEEACEFIERRAAKSFDSEIVACLTRLMLPE